jgi:hypothetical protein
MEKLIVVPHHRCAENNLPPVLKTKSRLHVVVSDSRVLRDLLIRNYRHVYF